MKIQFRVITKTYMEAGMLEEFLKKEGLEYEEMAMDVKMVKAHHEPVPKRTRLFKFQGTHISRILNLCKMYPNYSNAKIAEACEFPISMQVVGQIRRGQHPLSPKKGRVSPIRSTNTK